MNADDGIEAYVYEAINSFNGDPPDTDYQRGYLRALLTVWREGLGYLDDTSTLAAEKLAAAPPPPNKA